MKKRIQTLFLALCSCFIVAKAQTNVPAQLQLPGQFQFKALNSLKQQSKTFSLANSDVATDIQSLTFASKKKNKTGLAIGGIVIAAVGIAMLAGGITMVKNANGQTSYTNTNGQEEGSLKGALGSLMAVGGGILTLGGSAMIVISLVHRK